MVTQTPRPIDPDQLVLSVVQVATALGFSQSYTWRLIADGTIPSFKIGGRRCVRRSDIDRLLEEAAASPDAPDGAS